MEFYNKSRLYSLLLDERKREPINISSTGYLTRFEDRQELYSLVDGTYVIRHREEGIGFGKVFNWISGECNGIDLLNYDFKDTEEAIDFCVTYSYVNYLLNNSMPYSSEHASAVMMRNKCLEFINSRSDFSRISRENVSPKYKGDRFDMTQYLTSENLDAFLQYHIEAKKQIKEYQETPEFALTNFMLEQKELKKQIRKAKLLMLRQKLFGKLAERSKGNQPSIPNADDKNL